MLLSRILLITSLYTLQGFLSGLKTSIPLYLASYKASWQEQGTFSWVLYPFSIKILWAPILDSIYVNRLGPHLTWLIPIQVSIGLLLIVLSYYIESLLKNLEIYSLTSIFFVIYFLIASQDIVVDGWSILLFSESNLQWSSTCQIIGQVIGTFFGSTFLLTFESANFTNRFIRRPLSLCEHSSGLFTLEQFTYSIGLIFLFVSFILVLIILTRKSSNRDSANSKRKKFVVMETYLSIYKLFQKKSVRQLAWILFTFGFGFAATSHMTMLTLIDNGLTRDTLSLLNLPLICVNILVPLCMSNIRHPLRWFSRIYLPQLFGCLILAIYVHKTPLFIDKSYYYPMLILVLCLNETMVFIMVASRMGFCARISEPRIAGTYMTLLATISNLGYSLSSTFIFYTAEYLPKTLAYPIEVGFCLLIGLVWINCFSKTIHHLGELPIEQWYLKPIESMTVKYM